MAFRSEYRVKRKTKFLAQIKASLGYMFPSYDSHGLFQWELLYLIIQRGTVYRMDVLFPLHDCGYNDWICKNVAIENSLTYLLTESCSGSCSGACLFFTYFLFI